MSQQTLNSISINELPRCQKHTRNGRCRMLVADPSSTLCPEHGRTPSKNSHAADLSTLLTAGLTEFKSAVPINDFLSRLLLHQAEGRIPPRRAAVMAYTCNLLLRTLPAIDRESGIKEKVKEEEVHLDFSDWPNEVRFVKGDAPPPPPPGAHLPAVVRRRLGYLSSANSGSQDSGNAVPNPANGTRNSENGVPR